MVNLGSVLFVAIGICSTGRIVGAFGSLPRVPLVRSAATSTTCFSSLQPATLPVKDAILDATTICPEFAALEIGAPVQIQVGNVNLARKAWKKRRRTRSPVLIPCSVLDVDRKAMLLHSIAYIVHKFGTPIKEQGLSEQRPEGYRTKDIAIHIRDVCRWYRQHFYSSLKKHAFDLGYETPNAMVTDLFTNELQEKHRVKVFLDKKEQLYLLAPMARVYGHKLAAKSAVLQFMEEGEEFVHTGKTRLRMSHRGPHQYEFVPLSAAIIADAKEEYVGKEGDVCTAHVHSFLEKGDGGSPLLMLSMKPRPAQPTVTLGAPPKKHPKPMGVFTKVNFDDLKPGEGPFSGQIVQVNAAEHVAYVDIGATSKNARRFRRVYGALHLTEEQLVNLMTTEPTWAKPPARPDPSMEEAFEDDKKASDALNSMQYDGKEEEGKMDADTPESGLLEAVDVDDLFGQEQSVSIKSEQSSPELETEVPNRQNTILKFVQYSENDNGDVQDGPVESDVLDNVDLDDFFGPEEEWVEEEEDEDDPSDIAYRDPSERRKRKRKIVAVVQNPRKQEVLPEEVSSSETLGDMSIDDLFEAGDGNKHKGNSLEIADGEDILASVEWDVDTEEDEVDESETDTDVVEEEIDIGKTFEVDVNEEENSEFELCATGAVSGAPATSAEQTELEADTEISDMPIPVQSTSSRDYETPKTGGNIALSVNEAPEVGVETPDTSSLEIQARPPPKSLRLGSKVDVYIRAVAKQSGKFVVSLTPEAKPMKEAKIEAARNRKLKNLIRKMGGDIEGILKLTGKECIGVIKAVSQRGDVVYVQPQYKTLPIGVAKIPTQLEGQKFVEGGEVMVRLDGIDESRGQLGMTVTAVNLV